MARATQRLKDAVVPWLSTPQMIATRMLISFEFGQWFGVKTLEYQARLVKEKREVATMKVREERIAAEAEKDADPIKY